MRRRRRERRACERGARRAAALARIAGRRRVVPPSELRDRQLGRCECRGVNEVSDLAVIDKNLAEIMPWCLFRQSAASPPRRARAARHSTRATPPWHDGTTIASYRPAHSPTPARRLAGRIEAFHDSDRGGRYGCPRRPDREAAGSWRRVRALGPRGRGGGKAGAQRCERQLEFATVPTAVVPERVTHSGTSAKPSRPSAPTPLASPHARGIATGLVASTECSGSAVAPKQCRVALDRVRTAGTTVPSARAREHRCRSNWPPRRMPGDCDRDEDCQEGLTCFQRDGYTAVPGCVGEGRRAGTTASQTVTRTRARACTQSS